ncbi:hypothetical protein DD237_002199 [Peronospora effusa]|uniref:C2H2-type domain-containing protein n=1 Tax=Peronospora effusa TaxID=542832 RepID=A0A425CCG2_9STRA|nr:hypothetical protein DD237_002199 [Peronospora effusa]
MNEQARPPQMFADSVNPGNVRQVVVLPCSVPNCERSFGNSFSLDEHLKKHAGGKRHICPIRTCGRRFSTEGNLSRHKRLHGPIISLKCPVVGCICTFRSENKLSKHMKFHLGSPVHVCQSPTCGRTFSTTGNLNRHMKTHHPELNIRNTMPMTVTAVPPLQRAHPSYDSPIGSDELLPSTWSLSTFNRAPSSPTSSCSSCVLPMMSSTSSLRPPNITFDSKQFDALVSVLNEQLKVEHLKPNVIKSDDHLMEQLAMIRPSVLDDMIRFHMDHL